MNTLIFQVDIKGYDFIANGFWRDFPRNEQMVSESKYYAIKYASKFNANYLCIHNSMLKGNYPPVYERLAVYELFEKYNYDQILYLDSDCMVSDDCPNLFDLNDFFVARNCDVGADPELLYPNDGPMHGFTPGYKKFFNSGVILFTREFFEETKAHWRQELDYWNTRNNDSIWDQSVINCLAYKYWPHDRINLLSEDYGCWWKESKYINHYSSFRKNEFIPKIL